MTEAGALETLMREAARLRAAGRAEEAINAYERLLARAPDLPDSWYNLALMQRQAGRYEAALQSYQAALDRSVSRPEEVHLNCAVIYADHLRREADAERELAAALACNPNYVPALLNLGNLCEDRGQRDEARVLYERCLAIEPGAFEALARLAGLGKAQSADDAMIARLRGALASPRAAAAERASLGFALGRLLDGCGAYAAAFEAYAQANRASRESGRGVVYDRRSQEKFVSQTMKRFAAGHPQARGASGTAPIFICGMFRSGSTLAEQVLAAHPRVTAGGEIDVLPEMVRKTLSPFPVAMAQVDANRLEELAAEYRARLAQMFPDAERITDKRPDNFLYIGLIKSLFPDAKIVHTVREVLDNCLSIYFLHLDHGMAYALDLLSIGHYYRQYRMLMAHWKSLYGADILDFDYDRFVHEPRAEAERLLGFCALEWDEAVLSFHNVENAVKTASVWQVREPLYTRASGRARHYTRQLAPLRAYLEGLCP